MRSRAYGSRVAFLPLTGLAALLLLTGCGGGKDAPTEPPKTEPPKATALRFAAAPTSTRAGEALGPTIRVEMIDSAGRLVTGSNAQITLALAGGTEGATLVGSTTAQSSGGVASFEGLKIERAGSGYTLQASASGLSSANSAPFTVLPAAAHQLAFLPIPAVDAHMFMGSPVEVEVQDRFGNRVPDWVGEVTLKLEQNPGEATVAGTLTRTVGQGVARFDDLIFSRPGTGYTLSAAADVLSAAESAPFRVRLTFTSVIAAGNHTCGLTGPGKAYCWGMNYVGQLGTGTAEDSYVPAAVAGGQLLVELEAGYDHTCGRTADEQAYCWGWGVEGQLGNDTKVNSNAPVAVSGGLTFARVAAGVYQSCGLTAAGQAYCWGNGYNGRLGNGTTANSSVPVAVSGGLSFAALAPGDPHTCALTAPGEAYCWGAGALGNGTTTPSSIPVAVSGELRFKALSAGKVHTCGLTPGGEAHCWGSNDQGQLGNGTKVNSDTSVAVTGGLTFAALAAGEYHSCGLTAAGQAYCWGQGRYGQLGTGATTDSFAPTAVAGGLTFAVLGAGGLHTCGLTTGGETYCWGRNAGGQLGTGGTEDSTTPVLVASTKR